MSGERPVGRITGDYVNRAGEHVWIVAWESAQPIPANHVSDNRFTHGQKVTLSVAGRLVATAR